MSVKLFLPPLSRRRSTAWGVSDLDRNSSSPEEGLSERVEVSEPDGTSNRQNACNPKKLVGRDQQFK